MSYAIDRRWGDTYLPAVRQVVGPRLLMPAPFENDAREATDLMVLKAQDFRVAVRIRRPGYALRFGDQFTIRYDRPTGAKTEYEKIVDGFGDWMLYGHASSTHRGELARWLLLDLDVFRDCMDKVRTPLRAITNPDGTSFIAFNVYRDFPSSILIDDSGERHELAA